MSEVEILLIERAVERLLMVIFGGMSLMMGCWLFAKGIAQNQAATFAMSSWKVKLQKVGPGVFFALFGTIVLVVTMVHPLKVDTTDKNCQANSKDPCTVHTDVSYDAQPSGASPLRLARAINSALKIKPSETQLSPAQQDQLKQAQQVLTDERNSLIEQNLKDRGLVALYQARGGFATNAMNPEEAARLEKVAPWMQDMAYQDDGSSPPQ